MNKNSLKQMIIAEMILEDARALLAKSSTKRSLFEMMDDSYLMELNDSGFVHSMKLKSTLFEAYSDSEDAPEDLPDSGGTPDDSDSEDAPEDSPDDDSGGDPDDSDSEDAPEDSTDDDSGGEPDDSDSEDAPEDSTDDDSGGEPDDSDSEDAPEDLPDSGGEPDDTNIGLAYLDTLYDDPSLAESRYSLTSLLYDL